MAHYKRKICRRIKGCCGMCMLRTTNGTRHGRLLTIQEKKSKISEKEYKEEILW